MASIKGKLFEYFMCRLLLHCGFRPVFPDGLLVYKGGPGLMVQGMGQAHNADVLLEPPFQTPFYFPTRLWVECKCYGSSVKLPVVRNVLGLREDINHFDIVTEDILKSRMPFSKGIQYYPIKRYQYQVAVASANGFSASAIPFAKAHRIPLISFENQKLFGNIHKCINSLEEKAQKDPAFSKCLLEAMEKNRYEEEEFLFLEAYDELSIEEYWQEVSRLSQEVVLGLLEDGTILFLFRRERSRSWNYEQGFERDYTIYWDSESEAWRLENGQQSYCFELPEEIYREWENEIVKKRMNAEKAGCDYRPEIILMEKTEDSEEIKVIRLSDRFMKEVKKKQEIG